MSEIDERNGAQVPARIDREFVNDETLRDLETTEDVLSFLASKGIEVIDAVKELGTGWVVPTDGEATKAALCGKELIIAWWTIQPGDYFRTVLNQKTGELEEERANFVTMFVITPDGQRYILNDGSTGIARQLEQFTQRTGRNAGLGCKQGFRVSEYRIDAKTKEPVGRDFAGNTEPAFTYYLAV